MKAPRDRSKSEIIRRRRLGDLRRLLRARCGPELPPDDAGREYLYELLLPISVGPNAVLKMPKAIELWAPWMQPDEAAELVDQLNRTPVRERKPKPRELGERLRLTNAERERLKLWSILPCDMTDQQLAEQRKAKARARVRRNRQKRGAKPRSRWLADNNISRTKPWKLAGFKCRRTWERHRKNAAANSNGGGQHQRRNPKCSPTCSASVRSEKPLHPQTMQTAPVSRARSKNGAGQRKLWTRP